MSHEVTFDEHSVPHVRIEQSQGSFTISLGSRKNHVDFDRARVSAATTLAFRPRHVASDFWVQRRAKHHISRGQRIFMSSQHTHVPL